MCMSLMATKKHESSYSCMKYAAMCFAKRMFRDRNTEKRTTGY